MKKRNVMMLMLIVVSALCANIAKAQIPAGYYDCLKGKKGADLKAAIHQLIGKAKVLNYGKGIGATWWGFYITDNDGGYVVDRYSNEKRKFGERGNSVAGMNIEHSFAKSWWGGEQNQAYHDLFNLMPSDANANSKKSNYCMGVVKTAEYDNQCIKVGTSAMGFKVWEPSEEWKGDFARDYMYMATAYSNLTWSNNAAKNQLEQNDYPTLKKWAYELYLKWARTDKVNTGEVRRNNAVYSIQGNRNPYIDFPNLMEYVWGDSVTYAFDPANTLTSEKISDDGNTPSDVEQLIYYANFKKIDGGCTIETVKNPVPEVEVWQRSASWGWKGTGSIKPEGANYVKKYDSEAYLLTPELNLEGLASARMAFNHTVNYAANPAAVLSVEVRHSKGATTLEGIQWPAGNTWIFNNSGDIDLTPFVGQHIKVAFHYTGTTKEASTWEISDLTVTGKKVTTGIGNTTVQAGRSFDPTLPYTIYDTTGRRLNSLNGYKGIAIVRQGGCTYKILK